MSEIMLDECRSGVVKIQDHVCMINKLDNFETRKGLIY